MNTDDKFSDTKVNRIIGSITHVGIQEEVQLNDVISKSTSLKEDVVETTSIGMIESDGKVKKEGYGELGEIDCNDALGVLTECREAYEFNLTFVDGGTSGEMKKNIKFYGSSECEETLNFQQIRSLLMNHFNFTYQNFMKEVRLIGGTNSIEGILSVLCVQAVTASGKEKQLKVNVNNEITVVGGIRSGESRMKKRIYQWKLKSNLVRHKWKMKLQL